MTMFYSQAEFQEFKTFVVLSVALKLRIKDAEWEPVEQLRASISAQNQQLGVLLASFLAAYESWYAFHARIDSAGKAGSLDAAATEELVKLVVDRDATRKQLLAGLAAVG